MDLSVVRHLGSAIWNLESAKWHSNAPTGLRHGGPTPHVFLMCVLRFLKDIFFVCDHEMLSYSATNSLKLI